MQMIGFYLVRGHDMDKLINLTNLEKIAYAEFMRIYQEEEATKLKIMSGNRV